MAFIVTHTIQHLVVTASHWVPVGQQMQLAGAGAWMSAPAQSPRMYSSVPHSCGELSPPNAPWGRGLCARTQTCN